jgi:type II secretory pathway pseudopilin PulG
MSVTELMVAICIIAILAAVAIPFYISYVQQARVVSIVIPRLHAIETNIALFYSLHEKLPGSNDKQKILDSTGSENLDVALSTGTITLTIKAPERVNKLHILDGKVLIAAPVISKSKIVSWHLAGELADRLRINH